MTTGTQPARDDDGHLEPIPNTPALNPPSESGVPPRRMGLGQRIVIFISLAVLVIPPAAGFYSYFTGVPLHLLASTAKEEADEASAAASARPSASLVPGQAHTIEVPDEVATALGIQKNGHESVIDAKPPRMMKSLVVPGSTDFDPTRLARVRARFAPARVVQIAQVQDHSATGQTEFRELRQGDRVSKGDVLAVFYSVDVGSKKNDLLDALVQLELDQTILDDAKKHQEAVPTVFMNTYYRAVQGDRNAINRALNNLKAWDIPQSEIDDLHAEAKKISADKDAWLKTPEGRWVRGEKQAMAGKADADKEKEDPWGRVTLRAPFDGVIVERNVHVGEMVVDNTVNLFQIADVKRLLVKAYCSEDALPSLEGLQGNERRWTVGTVGTGTLGGIPGHIDEIGYIIDPNQHTAILKGFIDNPGQRVRAGQFVTATVNLPPPADVVEIPTDAVVDDGLQSLVFVQPDAAVRKFTMRRVQVTHRFERSVFVRSSPIPKEEQLTTHEAEEGLLPKQPLRPGERVLLAGSVELKAAVIDLESRAEKKPAERVAKGKTRSGSDPEQRAEQKPKADRG